MPLEGSPYRTIRTLVIGHLLRLHIRHCPKQILAHPPHDFLRFAKVDLGVLLSNLRRAMTKDDKTVLAVVDAKSGGQNYQVLYDGESFECVDWTSDGQQIVVPMRDVNRGGLVSLFAIDVEKPSEPRLLENLPIDRKVSDPSFSPDGKQLTVQAFKRAPAAK